MSAATVRAPVILVHGILGFSKLPLIGRYFHGIREALRADGNIVPEPPQLNPAGTVEERTGDLERYLNNPDDPEVFGKPVHIIAHSMGGLDARHLISRNTKAMPDGYPRVLTLTALGTPHQGTPVADLAIEEGGLALDSLLALNIDIRGVKDLTTSAAVQFNQVNPDATNVKYFSIAGQFEPLALDLLKPTYDIIVAAGSGPNDGLVPISSAQYGRFLGIWQADHFRLINQGTSFLRTPLDALDPSIVDGYRGIVQRLAEEGF